MKEEKTPRERIDSFLDTLYEHQDIIAFVMIAIIVIFLLLIIMLVIATIFIGIFR